MALNVKPLFGLDHPTSTPVTDSMEMGECDVGLNADQDFELKRHMREDVEDDFEHKIFAKTTKKLNVL